MSIKSIEMEHMRPSAWGWSCPFCQATFTNAVGAIWHEEAIDDGKCPNLTEETDNV